MNTFKALTIKNSIVSPALFLAPMAGVTHSAYRRLVADFGGYGALFTEMLSGKAILHEKVGVTPFTKKRPEEGTVFYQLALNGTEDIEAIVERLRLVSPAALDLNAGCPAPEMERVGAGVSLFQDLNRFERVLKSLRTNWDGVLTVKCRLWITDAEWKPEFLKRLRLLEDCGVDAVFVHPRFFDEKLKRNARWSHFEWICAQTKLPVIANGDIASYADITDHAASFASVKGFMIGRQAVVKPWLFREFSDQLHGKEKLSFEINYADIWDRYFKYVNEDFPVEKAIGRIKEFTKYYSCNFFFGHTLKSIAQGAASLDELYDKTMSFLNTEPRVALKPAVAGI